MSDLIQTIQASLLALVGRGVQIIPAFIAAIAVLLATRYGAIPVKRITGATLEKLVGSPSLRALFIQLVSVALWGTGILIACILIFPDLGLGDLIALLGLGSVAIGFAFQDIFKNFLAGVLLLLNEPFRLNDQIIVADFEGTVEAINVRSTEIRTYQGERVVIPNAIVFTSAVQVLTDRPSRRTDLAIGLDYNTPLPRARQLLQTALADVEGVLHHPPVEVDLVGFGDSSIDLVVRYWSLPQAVHMRQTRSQVVMALKSACDAADLNIPYPIRSVYFFDQQTFNDHRASSSNLSNSAH
ncbi:MAG: mechanosensitive ion channel family protein [Leptolyngbya sp. DLM2.Bin15]|nr:MAG: mechanosensitive ion channel family protein [Leptolyngbya sp. DLM2.Bin15]